MRRSLLNKRILPKPLRQALVLITLLLLPNAAWGEEEIKTTFTGYNNSSITFNDNSYMWEIVENQNATFETYEYNNDNSLKISPSTDGAQITVMLKSKFTVSGTLSTNDLLSTLAMGSVETVGTSNGNFKFLYGTSTSPTELLSTQSVTWPIENIELSANNFSNDIELSKSHIYIEISGFTKAIYLKSITLSNKLTESFDIKVAGIVPEENGDITGASPTGTVTYDATTRTLTLKNATITGNIIKQSSADDKTLIVNLDGNNTLNGTFFFNDQIPGDLTFTGTGSLTITSESIFDTSVNSVNTANGLYLATDDPNLYTAPSATISPTVAYPIWVYNSSSTTKYTQLTANASSYTTAEANVDENHKGSVSYSANTNTLTLDNFFCKTTENSAYVFQIGGSLTNLTVNLKGTNETSHYCFNYLKPTDGDDLQLTYTTSNNGSLEFDSDPNEWYMNFAYDKGLGYYPWKISTDWPRLQIGNTYVRGTVTSVDGYSNISYNDESKTLTLSGATIGDVSSTNTDISVYLDDLTVEISGTNTIYGRFWGQYSENGSFAGKINFKNADFANASLLIHASPGLVYEFTDCQLSKDIKITEAKYNQASVDVNAVTYENGNFVYGSQKNVLTEITLSYQAPQLTVAGIEPDSEGKFEGLAGVTYTPPTISLDSQIPDTPATLTLDGATIDGYISSSIENLTVYLKGSSTINAGTNVSPFRYFMATETSSSTGSLTFDSTDEDEGMLTMNGISAENKIASGYTVSPKFTYYDYDSNYEGWIKGSYSDPESIFIYKNVNYNLWISNMEGTSTIQYNKYNVANTEYGPVYHPETHSLDITGNYSYYIKSSLPVLTLNLKPGGIIPKVVFEPKDEEESGSLEIITKEETASITFGSNTNTQPVISGFSDVVYDGFTILSDGAQYDKTGMQLVNASGTAMTEAVFESSVEINKPTFDSTSGDGGVWVLLTNDNKYTIVTNSEVTPVESHDINYGTIKYSIEYADGSEGVTDEIFTEAFTISKPATVTAKVTLNGKESANAIGKYFGASKEEYTVAIGDKIEGTSWFTPVIESGDQIESKFMLQEIDESGIFEMGGEGPDHYLVAKKSGETTVIAYLFNSSNSSSSSTGTTVLNVSEEPILITFTVGESLSSVFEGNNNYGGLYNDSDTPYAVPEGMTAYLVTGISEDGTSVTTQDIGYLPARTAVLLLKGEGAKAITKIPYKGSATVPTNNKFYYSDPNSPATAPTTRSWYVIYNNKFMKVTGGTKVNGGKCYLDLGTTAGTRGFYNIGGGEGTTSLREVISEGVNSKKWADGEWYTLQGQRVVKPAKGLYILNGKKVVVK